VENVVGVLFPELFRKLHFQLVGLFVDVSVNETDRGAVPDKGAAVNDATGTGRFTVI
jgi:hypothetical protein